MWRNLKWKWTFGEVYGIIILENSANWVKSKMEMVDESGTTKPLLKSVDSP